MKFRKAIYSGFIYSKPHLLDSPECLIEISLEESITRPYLQAHKWPANVVEDEQLGKAHDGLHKRQAVGHLPVQEKQHLTSPITHSSSEQVPACPGSITFR